MTRTALTAAGTGWVCRAAKSTPSESSTMARRGSGAVSASRTLSGQRRKGGVAANRQAIDGGAQGALSR